MDVGGVGWKSLVLFEGGIAKRIVDGAGRGGVSLSSSERLTGGRKAGSIVSGWGVVFTNPTRTQHVYAVQLHICVYLLGVYKGR